jgi:hypothetical protein
MAMSEFSKDLMSRGFSFVCSHCVKLHAGLNRGETHCGFALKGRDCGGPISGLCFPEYEGILSRATIAKSCFRCGKEATRLVSVKGGFVGACDEHVRMIDTMAPMIPFRGKIA